MIIIGLQARSQFEKISAWFFVGNLVLLPFQTLQKPG
jgi:hypothetical protein